MKPGSLCYSFKQKLRPPDNRIKKAVSTLSDTAFLLLKKSLKTYFISTGINTNGVGRQEAPGGE